MNAQNLTQLAKDRRDLEHQLLADRIVRFEFASDGRTSSVKFALQPKHLAAPDRLATELRERLGTQLRYHAAGLNLNYDAIVTMPGAEPLGETLWAADRTFSDADPKFVKLSAGRFSGVTVGSEDLDRLSGKLALLVDTTSENAELQSEAVNRLREHRVKITHILVVVGEQSGVHSLAPAYYIHPLFTKRLMLLLLPA